jgi:hypothetical protein
MTDALKAGVKSLVVIMDGIHLQQKTDVECARVLDNPAELMLEPIKLPLLALVII